MEPESSEPTWDELSAEILSGMREWRLQHPKATLREIETALDAHFVTLRARMLQDMALQSVASDWKQAAQSERPVCAGCGTLLILRGKHARHLKTSGGQDITLQRSYGLCPTCKKGLFPPR